MPKGCLSIYKIGFGFCNGQATFQRAVNLVRNGLTWKGVIAFGRHYGTWKIFADNLIQLEAFSSVSKVQPEVETSQVSIIWAD